jgi:hypothetical protein
MEEQILETHNETNNETIIIYIDNNNNDNDSMPELQTDSSDSYNDMPELVPLEEININEDEIVRNILNYAWANYEDCSNDLLISLEMCYLENARYDDDIRDLIRYTIKYFYERNNIRHENLNILTSVIINYAVTEKNVIFNTNLDMVLTIINIEIKNLLRSINIINIDMLILPEPEQELNDIPLIMEISEINKIETINYIDLCHEIKQDNKNCIICCENFIDSDNIKNLSCSHIFHSHCIDIWLSEYSYKCPCCRIQVGNYKANIN